jgi:uncharacterized repeat protein (TIGR03803 family)
LILSCNTLYGTASSGGSSGVGTVFAVNTDGAGFINLHSFTDVDQTYYTNNDGAVPYAGLILSGTTLYGTAIGGGSSGFGTVFAINTNGADFTNLHSFSGVDQAYHTNSDGAIPVAGLLLAGNTLYGTASQGGSSGNGTVFSLSLGSVSPPPDSDGDGVPDAIDQCPETHRSAIVYATGCSIAQLVPCDGPRSSGTWKNHGQYVSAVLQSATDFLKARLITRRQWGQIVTAAAHSKCGWNRRSDHDENRDWHRDWDCTRDSDWGRARNWGRD